MQPHLLYILPPDPLQALTTHLPFLLQLLMFFSQTRITPISRINPHKFPDLLAVSLFFVVVGCLMGARVHEFLDLVFLLVLHNLATSEAVIYY